MSTLGARAPALVALLFSPSDQSPCCTNEKKNPTKQEQKKCRPTNQQKQLKTERIAPKSCEDAIHGGVKLSLKNHR
jgi:hypothetical protein